jgi:hypothetical protein
MDKAALEQVFSEYFGFPCQSSFHQFLHHYNHPGLAQLVTGGRSAKWTPPPTIPIKKIILGALTVFLPIRFRNVGLGKWKVLLLLPIFVKVFEVVCSD